MKDYHDLEYMEHAPESEYAKSEAHYIPPHAVFR